MSRDRQAREKAVRRRLGVSPQRRREINAHLDTLEDFRATCKKCGGEVRGSLKDLARHRCKS